LGSHGSEYGDVFWNVAPFSLGEPDSGASSSEKHYKHCGDQMKDEIARVCSMHSNEKCKKIVGKHHSEDLGRSGRIILKYRLGKYSFGMFIGFMWLIGIGCSRGMQANNITPLQTINL
jgi:hypothetical protein